MKNILTIDLEDYYHVSGFSDIAPLEKWSEFPCRIESNVKKILSDLGETRATFFILGWVAERFPELIRDIAEAGHEIATHGSRHRMLTEMSRDEFKADLINAKSLLEDITGLPVMGHRAPSFSVTEETPWAFEVLAELGFKYDSSVFPIKRRRGGLAGAKSEPYPIDTPFGIIHEFPLAVWRLFKYKMPFAGGGFFRLYPYRMTAGLIRKLNANGKLVVVYLHPWEFDPEQPRLKSRFSRNGFNHYVGLKKTRHKFKNLIADFDFISILEYLETNQI